jgi:hypothetical protein
MDQPSADSLISDHNEDALGYWPFAESLAKGLIQRVPKKIVSSWIYELIGE